MKNLFRALFPILIACVAQHAAGQNAAAIEQTSKQDVQTLRAIVEQFLQRQTVGLPGEISISAGSIDARLNLPACTLPEAFLPAGGKIWGKTSVGIRCNAPSPWTMYTVANVRVVGEYLSAARAVMQGEVIGQHDIVKLRGDLTAMPQGVITDSAQAIGRTAVMALKPGSPLRHDLLRSQKAVQQGQIVKLISKGPGFQVSTDGKALSNGIEGQVVQASTPNGQIVSGIAKAQGVVEIVY